VKCLTWPRGLDLEYLACRRWFKESVDGQKVLRSEVVLQHRELIMNGFSYFFHWIFTVALYATRYLRPTLTAISGALTFTCRFVLDFYEAKHRSVRRHHLRHNRMRHRAKRIFE
jgi:hypothetical protein